MAGFHVNSFLEDPYTVLGVSNCATQDEIKQAFKRLALRYHPDKCLDDGTMFKNINNAYQILSDPDKRNQLNYEHCTATNSVFSASFNTIICALWQILMEKMKQSPTHTKTVPESVNDHENIRLFHKTVRLNVTVKLKEVYEKQIKRLHVRVKRMIDDKIQDQTIHLYLSLLNIEDEYIYKGMGDDWYDTAGHIRRGDVVVHLTIEEHSTIHIDKLLTKYDLYIERHMSLYEMYFGVDDVIDFFDENIKVNFSSETLMKYIQNSSMYSYVHIEKGKGLPYYDSESDEEMRGDLYVFYRLYLPLDGYKLNDIEIIIKQYFNEVPRVHSFC